jgi:hypothetical protein
MIDTYSGCASGLAGPEVVYVLQVTSPLNHVSIELGTTADLAVLALSGPNPAQCLAMSFGNVTLSSVSPGLYYIVVDGFGQGSYTINVRCDPPAQDTPTPTATTTLSPTTGPSPTPTNTLKPGGGQPIYLPVMLKAPIQFLVNCGSPADYVDSQSRRWLADREYAAGSWGWVDHTMAWSTARSIEGTVDDPLYQAQRFGNASSFTYRFDLPNGTYEVELRFAEIYPEVRNPGQRLFDVRIEGQTVVDNLDVVAQAPGTFRALGRTFTTQVLDGQLNITFVRDWVQSQFDPIINGIRVTQLAGQ